MAQTSAYMARTDRFIQKTDAFMDRTEMKLQNHDATLKSLETQVGQISQILSSRPIGGFPSDTKVAKGPTHEKCKAITTRSGKILTQTSNKRGTVTSPSAAIDTPTEADEPAQTSGDHCDPLNTTTGESSAESSHARSDKPEKIRPPSPFPQRLNKQKQDYQFKKFFDILKQVHINLPLVEALQQMPNYAKFLKDMVTRKKRIEEFETAAATETCLALMHNKVPAKKTDLGSFTIECFIGHNYPTKALCDPGASINLMPKSVFRKLGIVEAKPTTVILQLADHSYVQPKGKIEDILVKVDKFIFPVDFLILDCEADEHAPIILGRPFLSTSRAVIDFDKDGIIFKVDDDSIKMKSLTKQLNKGKGIAKSPTKDTPRTKLYMGAHVERDRATMLKINVEAQEEGREKAQGVCPTKACLKQKISEGRYFTTGNSCKKRGRFSRPITAGSQICVRNASAISLELGGQLIPVQRYLEATCPLYNRIASANLSARYTMIAAKNRWEEQGFYFDDSQVNYGLEQFVYNRLNELGWFRLARQPARANYNWVIEFYASNFAGEDHAIVRGRRVPANAATINAILGLPDNDPNFYAMLGGFEEEDFELIKDYLCEEGTA
ncbi:hypothetical protein V6N12_049146 [Hibiscus sabdariffa]|uniref:Uncharacterized protein n=1 Tax=Hibiscus sabdariffa TaxID=183260 RepID=A0ABR2EJC0_9ROSI